MRCLTLAEELSRKGHECIFICREHEGHLEELIRSKGFALHLLPAPETEDLIPTNISRSAYAEWLGASWQQDARQSLEILRQYPVDWLVADHYALDAEWEKCISKAVCKIMVIDDLADREHDCDLLLDQNLGRKEADYQELVSSHCNLMIGPRYSLLRPEFARLRAYSLKRREHPKLGKLLITMGGVDKDNATGIVLEALKGCPLPDDCQIDVVMGANAPWLVKVQEIAVQMPWPTEVSIGVADMAHRMADADLAIGAAGGTSWERCCLGLPAILVLLADNQIPGARALEAVGAAVTISDPISVRRALSPALTKVIMPETLKRISHAASAAIDGKGASSIVAAMIAITG
jgi:UDP-2,4-diacetamido-2,4,6-trideoxy-beta-L-altropyranose hydrolase